MRRPAIRTALAGIGIALRATLIAILPLGVVGGIGRDRETGTGIVLPGLVGIRLIVRLPLAVRVLLRVMLVHVRQAGGLFLLIAVLPAVPILRLTGIPIVDVLDHRIAQSRNQLAVGHAVVDVRALKELLHAALAKQVAHAPHQTLDAIRTIAHVNAVGVEQGALNRQVVVVVRIGILQGGELGGVGRIRRVPRLVEDLRGRAELARRVVVHLVRRILQHIAIRERRPEHVVLGGIVAVHLLDKRQQAVAAVKLVIAHRVVAVAIREALVVIATALVLGEVLHLVGKRHGGKRRGRTCRGERRNALGALVVVRLVVVRGRGIPHAVGVAVRGGRLLRVGDGGQGNTAERKRNGKSGDDRLIAMLRHMSSSGPPSTWGWLRLRCVCGKVTKGCTQYERKDASRICVLERIFLFFTPSPCGVVEGPARPRGRSP